MRARGFNKKVEVWGLSPVFDNYSGNVAGEDTLLSHSWAKIKTLSTNNTINNEFGVLDASNSISITLRKRNDLTYDLQTMYIKYRGQKYIIKSFPVNIDFEDALITIICTKESNLLENISE